MKRILLDIHNGFNFRDLGDYETRDGRKLKTHKVLRSGRLNELSDRDINYLADYGMRYDVDFRSPEEEKNAPDRYASGIDYRFTPVFPTDETNVSKSFEELRAEFASDPLAGFNHMVHTYEDIAKLDSAKQAYRRFFETLLENTGENESVLFHCSAGKDRTGMGAVFFLTALGVDPDTVRSDYLASNKYLRSETERMINQVKNANGTPQLVASTRSLAGVANEYLDAALLTINDSYAHTMDFIQQEIGLSDAEIADLKRIYLQ